MKGKLHRMWPECVHGAESMLSTDTGSASFEEGGEAARMSDPLRGAPRPRLLASGFEPSEIEAIRPFAGSLWVTSDLLDVHPEEHDVLLLAQAELNDYRAGFPRRIAFAPRAEPMEAKPAYPTVRYSSSIGGEPPPTRAETQFRPARDFQVTEFAREQGLEALVRRSCLPDEGATYTGFRTPVGPSHVTHVLAQEALDRPLALAALLETDRSAFGPSSIFWLPAIARPYLAEWLPVALAHWRRTAPDTFPATADWHRAEQWASPQETAARARLVAFEAEEAERQRAAEATRRSLSAARDQAEEEGTQWRALLFESGDALVEAVQEAFESLGFEVVQADELPQHQGKKREDLRVSDGAWVALVEVKGYKGAAKSNDLLQLTSAGTTFAAAQGREPEALWYVPNVYRESDPAQRPIALAGRDEDVAAFGENHHPCVIDARELFALRQRTALGQLTQDVARDVLKRTTGRLLLETDDHQ